MVKSLCKHYSPPLVSIAPPSETGEPESYHPFPPPSALVAPEVATTLRTLGFGYRANFIQKTAQMLVEEHGLPNGAQGVEEPAVRWLATLRDVSTVKVLSHLLISQAVLTLIRPELDCSS
jgi:N-glycosylase/DNA lyase